MSTFLFTRMPAFGDALAVAESDTAHSYRELLVKIEGWRRRLASERVAPGAVVALEGDYGADAIAAFLALMRNANIVVPLSRDSQVHASEFLDIAEVEHRILCQQEQIQGTGRSTRHALYGVLRERGAAGLVLFSSGSTGRPKAAVHDLDRLLEKFERPRHCYRTLVFLQLDHIGGVNTLFYTLANGGAVVVARSRSPRDVAETIAQHQVELLPTSPTFLNLLVLSGAGERDDLSSLKLITYGTEPMPESTLKRLGETLPHVRLQQTYGLTEVGILRSQSRGNDSLWVRVGGEGYETKVVDGRLWVRAASAMLGYLNAPSPFDAEGFLDTGDRVEVDGDWLRILGRESDIINVGGQKVYPAEVESLLLQMEDVVDVVVHAESHPLTGQVVAATVRLAAEEPLSAFKTRLRRFCQDRVPAYKVPVRVRLTVESLHSARFKRVRGLSAARNLGALEGSA